MLQRVDRKLGGQRGLETLLGFITRPRYSSVMPHAEKTIFFEAVSKKIKQNKHMLTLVKVGPQAVLC